MEITRDQLIMRDVLPDIEQKNGFRRRSAFFQLASSLKGKNTSQRVTGKIVRSGLVMPNDGLRIGVADSINCCGYASAVD